MNTVHDKPFRFKQFEVHQAKSAMRVGTDAVILGCWAGVNGNVHSVLDVGTGTGVIALICAQRNPSARIDAVEIDPASAEDAALNFQLSPWSGRMHLFCGDYLEMECGRKYDLIISNPPYFSDSFRASDPVRSKARHDDALPAEKFMLKSEELLRPEGHVTIIIPVNQMARWMKAAGDVHLHAYRICHVFTLADREASRVMVEFNRTDSREPRMESLLIERKPGEFSQAYQDLTKDFYTRW